MHGEIEYSCVGADYNVIRQFLQKFRFIKFYFEMAKK